VTESRLKRIEQVLRSMELKRAEQITAEHSCRSSALRTDGEHHS
jgi:hypothetical protein